MTSCLLPRPCQLTSQLTPRTRQLRLRARWEQARRDPAVFLAGFVFTLDQHDRDHPIKQFPIARPHIIPLVRLWQGNPLLSVRKSRQMLCTWLFCLLALWDCLFHDGRLVMLQSKRADDAIGDEVAGDGPLGRAKFALNNIPGKASLGLVEGRDYIKLHNQVRFPTRSSTLWAIPQGANIIRQRTASGILSDESHFQDEFADAYTAALPCIRGGGWFVSLSTAHVGAANDLHEDNLHADR